jgi:hypothetical protein
MTLCPPSRTGVDAQGQGFSITIFPKLYQKLLHHAIRGQPQNGQGGKDMSVSYRDWLLLVLRGGYALLHLGQRTCPRVEERRLGGQPVVLSRIRPNYHVPATGGDPRKRYWLLASGLPIVSHLPVAVLQVAIPEEGTGERALSPDSE